MPSVTTDCDIPNTIPPQASSLETEHDGHLPLVKAFLSRTPIGRVAIHEIGLEAATQQGLVAVIHAARLFEPERGNSFTTYAWNWLRAYLQRAIEKDRRGRAQQSIDAMLEDPAAAFDKEDCRHGTAWSDIPELVRSWLEELGRDGRICIDRWFDCERVQDLADRYRISTQRVRQIVDDVRTRLLKRFPRLAS